MGITMAMYQAKSLAPNLEKNIIKCISLWSKNPGIALETFRKEVNVPEANILVSLLFRIEESGIGNLEGVIQKESRNIDKLRETAAKTRIQLRPVYFMAFRALPLVASAGIFIGAFMYKFMTNYKALGIF